MIHRAVSKGHFQELTTWVVAHGEQIRRLDWSQGEPGPNGGSRSRPRPWFMFERALGRLIDYRNGRRLGALPVTDETKIV